MTGRPVRSGPPPVPGETPIGRRVAYWRGRRGMSQQVFADRLGKSKSWVDKIERGARALDKLSTLHEIADVLGVDVGLLTGQDPPREPGTGHGIDQREVEALRCVLERYETLTPFFAAGGEVPPLDGIRKSVRHAWLALQYARYVVLARSLPKVLCDAQAADATHTGDAGREAAHLLSQTYQIASTALRKLGEHELAWLAADRAVEAAHRSGDPLLAGVAICRTGNALLALGRPRSAFEANVNFAGRLASGSRQTGGPRWLSVYGTLLLQGAIAAARIGDAAAVRDLLTGATETAENIGVDRDDYWTSFGPTAVQVYRAAAHVELGDGRQAVAAGQEIPDHQFNGLPPVVRAHHLLDQARAFTYLRDPDQAGAVLLCAAQHAPGEIHCRPLAHQVLADVLHRSQAPVPQQIQHLADDMRVEIPPHIRPATSERLLLAYA